MIKAEDSGVLLKGTLHDLCLDAYRIMVSILEASHSTNDIETVNISATMLTAGLACSQLVIEKRHDIKIDVSNEEITARITKLFAMMQADEDYEVKEPEVTIDREKTEAALEELLNILKGDEDDG